MKKTVLLVVVLSLLISMMTVTSSAVYDGESWGYVPFTYEDIEIDAIKDEAYENAFVWQPTKPSGSTNSIESAYAYYLHDGEAIYIFVEVKDPTPIPVDETKKAADKSFWDADGVEISFDMTNDGDNRFKATIWKDGWYIVSSTKDYSYDLTSMFEVEAAEADGGYVIEAKFYLDTADGVTTGAEIGLDFAVNDMIAAGKRTMLRSEHSLGAYDNTVHLFDFVVLSEYEDTSELPPYDNGFGKTETDKVTETDKATGTDEDETDSDSTVTERPKSTKQPTDDDGDSEADTSEVNTTAIAIAVAAAAVAVVAIIVIVAVIKKKK